jgi:hypothetical protein
MHTSGCTYEKIMLIFYKNVFLEEMYFLNLYENIGLVCDMKKNLNLINLICFGPTIFLQYRLELILEHTRKYTNYTKLWRN